MPRGTYRYYIIQMLETDETPHRYWIWNKWGRVGEERGFQNASRGPMSKEQAKSDFNGKVRVTRHLSPSTSLCKACFTHLLRCRVCSRSLSVVSVMATASFFLSLTNWRIRCPDI